MQNLWWNLKDFLQELCPGIEIPNTCPRINIIGAQSAIAADCDIAIALFVYSNTFAHTGFRQIVMSSRGKLLSLELWERLDEIRYTTATKFNHQVVLLKHWYTEMDPGHYATGSISVYPSSNGNAQKNLVSAVRGSFLFSTLIVLLGILSYCFGDFLFSETPTSILYY